MADTDPDSKTEEPTGKRLAEARSQGDVAKSMDLPQWATLCAVAGVIFMLGGWLAQNLMMSQQPFIAHPDAFVLENGGGVEVARMALMAALPPFIIVTASAAVAGNNANVVQTGFLWAPDKIKPDISKLTLFKGAGRIFGLDSWVNFGKSLIKAVVIGLICWQTLKPHAAELNQLVGFEPQRLLPFMMDVLKAMFLSVLGALGVGAIGDWVWQ